MTQLPNLPPPVADVRRNELPASLGAPNAAGRVPIPHGARRMPPVSRTQRTEWLNVPRSHAAPVTAGSADWPVAAVYARMAFRADEWHAELAEPSMPGERN
jgi:hypothetical protein